MAPLICPRYAAATEGRRSGGDRCGGRERFVGVRCLDLRSCVGVGERWRDGRTAVGGKIKDATQWVRGNGIDDSTEEQSYQEDDDAS